MLKQTIRKGFTLVEILIVVVILGILAAIVVPQFTNATQDAQAGNIKAQLDTLNNQLELFRARETTHAYPTAADYAAASTSNPAYTTWGTLIDRGYVKAPPVNPVNGSSTVIFSAAGDAAAGWYFDAATNTLKASYFDGDKITPGTP
ncbi:MAG: prepilin-type N-terminal cleavage/methylation domain-containing protein [Phycisphaeraceae bacterium]|nr:prepilin-type N-terminal cleavage/methylation domain-containing protein [Phycisphaeraceae bacterium]